MFRKTPVIFFPLFLVRKGFIRFLDPEKVLFVPPAGTGVGMIFFTADAVCLFYFIQVGGPFYT